MLQVAFGMEILLDETFESPGLPGGWQVVDNNTSGSNNPLFTNTSGHNGTGGNAGSGGHIGDNIDGGANSTVGGFLLAPISLEPRRNFLLTFDIRIDHEGTIDDAQIIIGDLMDGPYLTIPFPADGQSINNDLFWVTNPATGEKTELLSNYGPAYADNTWYRAEIQWVSVSGTSGIMTMKVFNPSTNLLVSGFTLSNVQLPDTVQLGLGTVNDRATFDNVRVEVVARTAMLKYWITTTSPLEAHRFWPNSPESVFPISKLDFRNLEGVAGVSNSWWNEGEIGDKENDQYKKFARIQGYLVPPETGAYTFNVAGRDKVTLYLSGSESTTVQRIAYTGTGGSDYQAWLTAPSQTSASIQLTKGNRYYFELHYDAPLGAFHSNQSFSAAWSGPGFSRRVLEGDDMEIYYPWKDVPKPERKPNGYQGKVGTWITYWKGSTESWWIADNYNGAKYWLNGEWKNLDWTNVEHINDALNQIVAAGIDFMIFDMTNGLRWYGRSRTIQMMAAHKGLKICFARDYGDSLPRVGGSAATDEEIWRWFVGRSYFGNRNHLIVDGKPLVVIYDVDTNFLIEANRTDNWAKRMTFVSADGYNGVRDLWGWQLRSDGAIPSARGMFVSGAIKAYNYASGDSWRNSYHFQDYNWLLARTRNPDHVIVGAWDDLAERNMWCIIDQSGVTDEMRRMPDQVGNLDGVNRYDRVRQWIHETPYVVPGGLIRDGAYKMLSRSSGYALRLKALFETAGSPQAGFYSQPAAYAPGCALAQETVINNIHGYIWISHLGNNEYKILPAHLGLPIEGSTSTNAMVTGLHADLVSQRWTAEPTAGGWFRFRNKATGKVISSPSTTRGATIAQATASGGQNQDWQMVSVMTMPSMGLWNGNFENKTVFDGTPEAGVSGWEAANGDVFTVNPAAGASLQAKSGNNYADLNLSRITQTTELQIKSNTDYLLLFAVYPKAPGNSGNVAAFAIGTDLSSSPLYSESGYGIGAIPAYAWTSRQMRLRASSLTAYVGKRFKLEFQGDMALDSIALIEAPAYSYSEWLVEFGISGAQADMTSDLDFDGLSNFQEYAFGGNPLVADAATVAPVFSVNNGSAKFTYRYRTDDLLLNYNLQFNNNLGNSPGWQNAGSMIYQTTTHGPTLTPGVESLSKFIDVTSKPMQFFRFMLEQSNGPSAP